MNSIIFKIVVDSALAKTVVFIWIFNNWLLEESTEIKNLAVVFQPLRRNSRDSVVFLLWTLGSSESGTT